MHYDTIRTEFELNNKSTAPYSSEQLKIESHTAPDRAQRISKLEIKDPRGSGVIFRIVAF